LESFKVVFWGHTRYVFSKGVEEVILEYLFYSILTEYIDYAEKVSLGSIGVPNLFKYSI